jgi:glycosyltransferase involved in cell wall biosynthesis
MSTQNQAPPSGPDLICFCGQDWWYHNRGHSDFQFMRRIARTRKVLLVNSLGMRMPTPGRSTRPFRRIFRKLGSILRYHRKPLPDLPNFSVFSPVFLPLYGNPTLRALNARFIRFQVELIARWRGIVEPHIFLTMPTAWDVAKSMKRSSLAYNRSDKHSAFDEADTSVIGELEDALLDRSDRVLYSARAFLETEREQVADRGYFLDHGVDLTRFLDPQRGRTELSNLPRPIIGFFGGFDDYVIDFDLLERVAREFDQASIVLIGDTTLPLDRLTQYDNVHYLGYRDYQEIPALGTEFDVALMPWLDNDWIRHCNPIKLKEYLALGVEIVTTWFPEIDHYEDLVHIARDSDEFIEAIGRVIDGEKAPGDREALLEHSTWDQRTQELLDLMDSVGKVKKCAA